MKRNDSIKKDWFIQSSPGKEVGIEYEEKAVKDHKYFVKVKSCHFLTNIKKRYDQLHVLNCLDLGCGTAETSEYFQNDFKYTAGCDYTFGVLKFALKKDLKNVFLINSLSEILPFKENSFNVAVLFNMIHHIDSNVKLMQTLKEVYRILSKDGVIAIYELNPLNPLTRYVVHTNEIDRAVNLDGFKKSLYPTTLYSWELRSLLMQCGFNIWNQEYLCFFPKCLSFFLPLERFLSKIPIGGLYSIFGMK